MPHRVASMTEARQAQPARSHRLRDAELLAYEGDGFVVRRDVFTPDEVTIEVSAGSTVTFGPFLVHQSTPNRSTSDRRALLHSYQPAGRATLLDSLRRMAGTGR